jgi:prevent-host-death family protein
MFTVKVKRNPKVGAKGRGTKVTGLVLADDHGNTVRAKDVDIRQMRTQEDVFGAVQELLREGVPDGHEVSVERYHWRFVKVAGEVRVLDSGTVERPATDIAVRELRNDVSSVLRRVVDRGERLRITVNGRPVAELAPLLARRETVPWDEVMDRLAGRRADAGLLDDLRDAAAGTTDELSIR